MVTRTVSIRRVYLVAALAATGLAIGGVPVPANAAQVAAVAAAAKSGQPTVPVKIPKTIEDSSCVLGEVKVATFVSVRTAPKATGKELERLNSGEKVWVCDSSRPGQFTGVVYGGADFTTCIPDDVKKAYSYVGPCKSGWIATKYLAIIAG
jgi:hypothetical protein